MTEAMKKEIMKAMKKDYSEGYKERNNEEKTMVKAMKGEKQKENILQNRPLTSYTINNSFQYIQFITQSLRFAYSTPKNIFDEAEKIGSLL